MRRLRQTVSLAVLILARGAAAAPPEVPDRAVPDRTAAQLLPASTFAYAELRRPTQLLDTVLGHPLRLKLEAQPEYQRATSTAEFLQFKLMLGFIEQQIGMTWPAAVNALAGDGLLLALDQETRGKVILARSPDPQAQRRILETLVRLARDDAKNKGQPDPLATSEYRQTTVYAQEENRTALCGPWLIFANKESLLKRIIDNYSDGDGKSLSQDGSFRKAQAASAPPGLGVRRFERAVGLGACCSAAKPTIRGENSFSAAFSMF